MWSFMRTVLISIRKPAKIAARVSPVEAVRYTEGAEIGALRKGKNKSGQDKQKKSTDGGKIWKMAWPNLARSKGRTVVVKVIKEKLASGKYLLYSATTDDNGVVNEKEMAHHAGDKVTLVLPDGSKREFEILSVIKENYYALTNRYSIMFCYYTTADIFKEMESADFIMSYLMNVEDQKEKSYGQFVENYTTTTEPLMDYESKQKYIDEFAGMKNLFILVGGTLSIVIGLIGILNFINLVLTNVVTRRKEFAMMEAIGMTKKLLLRMLILEGLYYAGITILAVLVFGSLFSFTVVRVLSGGIWFMKYKFVIWPMLAACPFLILFGIVVPYLAYAPQRKNSLVEEIRKNE